jgi:hypothetical protein
MDKKPADGPAAMQAKTRGSGVVSGFQVGDEAARELGRRGGLKRAENMSPERRSEIARAAAKRRWEKSLGS